MDPVSAVVGVWLFLAGYITRMVMNRRTRRAADAPVCGCEHHLSMHDPVSGNCHGQVDTLIVPPSVGRTFREWRQCTCRRYVGPELLPDVWAAPPMNIPPTIGH